MSTTITVNLFLYFFHFIILIIIIYWQYNLINTLLDKWIDISLSKWRKQLNEDIDNILEENNEKDS